MPDYISNNLTAIIIAAIGLLIGITILVPTTVKSKRTDNSNRVNQSNSKVSGDQAGRDINKR